MESSNIGYVAYDADDDDDADVGTTIGHGGNERHEVRPHPPALKKRVPSQQHVKLLQQWCVGQHRAIPEQAEGSKECTLVPVPLRGMHSSRACATAPPTHRHTH